MTDTQPDVERLKPRRLPRQERGRRRVAQILDATAELVDTVGPQAVTTNAIARAAGVPIGSVYQFFPNKEAIFHALLEQQIDALDARFAPVIEAGLEGADLEKLVDRAVDELCDAYLELPGLAVLVGTVRASPDFDETYALNNAKLGSWIAELLPRRLPDMTRARARVVATVLVEGADGVIKHWLRSKARGDRPSPLLLEELKRMLRSYLARG